MSKGVSGVLDTLRMVGLRFGHAPEDIRDMAWRDVMLMLTAYMEDTHGRL